MSRVRRGVGDHDVVTGGNRGARQRAPGLVGSDNAEGCHRWPLRQSEEAAAAIAFLASDQASSVAGHILYIDGGANQIRDTAASRR